MISLSYLLASLDVVSAISVATETAAKAGDGGASCSVGHDHLLLHSALHCGHNVVATVLVDSLLGVTAVCHLLQHNNNQTLLSN